MKKKTCWNLIVQRTRTGCKVWDTTGENASWRYILNGDSAIVGDITVLVGEDCVLMEKGGEEQLLSI